MYIKNVPALKGAAQAWGGHFPTGARMVLHGTGDHPLAALSNLTSSVKVEGPCCKVYGYTNADCPGPQGNPTWGPGSRAPGGAHKGPGPQGSRILYF